MSDQEQAARSDIKTESAQSAQAECDAVGNITQGEAGSISAFRAAAPKPEYKFKMFESVVAFVALAVGIMFARYVVWHVSGYFTTLTMWALLALCTVFLQKSAIKLHRTSRVLIGIIAAFALVFSITDNGIIKFLVICFELSAGAYFVYSAALPRETLDGRLRYDVGASLISVPFSAFGSELRALAGSGERKREGHAASQVLMGLIIAIPLTLVVAPLLMTADQQMRKMLESAFRGVSDNIGSAVIQLVMGVLVACYVFGMLYANAHHFKAAQCSNEAFEQRLSAYRSVPNLAAYIAVTPILALYAMYLALQSSYFFSAFSGVLPAGFSYSGYARQGFFELCALSVINLVVIFAINRFTAKSGENRTRPLRAVTVTVCSATLLIISTALSKMLLYIKNVGLTRLRVYTSWFMVLLALVFVYIVIQQFKTKFPFVRVAVITAVAMFAMLAFSQSDYWIARYNVEAYISGRNKELDSYMIMYELSDDASVYLLEQQGKIKDGADRYNEEIMQYKLNDYKRDKFSTYNIPSMLTRSELERTLNK